MNGQTTSCCEYDFKKTVKLLLLCDYCYYCYYVIGDVTPQQAPYYYYSQTEELRESPSVYLSYYSFSYLV